MIEIYKPFGLLHVFLYSINTIIYHFWFMKYRQIDVYIYKCDCVWGLCWVFVL